MAKRLALIVAAILIAIPSVATAKPRHHRHIARAAHAEIVCDRQGCRSSEVGPASGLRYAAAVSRSDPRPSAWCGRQMRQWFGVADRAFNLARKWASYGTRADGPAEGVIVVWAHHVGLITGRVNGEWVVKSGNDNHAVRERPRSLRGVIAFRNPPQRFAGL